MGVGTEEFVTCFVDNSQIGESSGYQPIIVTSADQLGMVEEEVTTEIIKSEIQVDVHNRDMHGGDSTADRLTCPDCGKLFTSKRSLVGHKKEKHSGTLEIFPCQHCGKNFSRKSNLKAHMDSIHFGKKFPCSYCERIFTNRSCMNLHVKKIHSETLYNL